VSWHRRFLAVAALAAGLTLAACASGSATTGSPGAADAQRLTVRASDAFRFEPSSITARAGQPVELTLQNDGQISHDFTLTRARRSPSSRWRPAGRPPPPRSPWIGRAPTASSARSRPAPRLARSAC